MAKQRYWYTDKHRIGIVEKGTNAVTKETITSDYSSISETLADGLRIYAIRRPDALGTNLTSTTENALLEIPEQYHDVIVNKAIASGYKDPRNFQLDRATYFDAEYDKGLREAKKFSKSRYRRGGFIKAYDF